MELIVAKRPLGFDVANGLVHGEYAVGNDPFRRRLVFRRHPLVEIIAIKQNDRVGGRRLALGARRNYFGHRLP